MYGRMVTCPFCYTNNDIIDLDANSGRCKSCGEYLRDDFEDEEY